MQPLTLCGHEAADCKVTKRIFELFHVIGDFEHWFVIVKPGKLNGVLKFFFKRDVFKLGDEMP